MTPGLQCAEHLVVAHGDAVAAERIHHVDEHRVTDDADLEALEVGKGLDRPLGIVDAAGAGIHPAQADEPGLGIIGDGIEQLLADRAVDHLLHMRGVSEQERQVDDVERIDHRAKRADADPRHCERADLGLLDRLLLAAELHGGKHLHGEPPVGRLVELLAKVFHRDDGGIAGRMDIRGLEHELLLRAASARQAGDCGSAQGAEHHCSSLHGSSRSTLRRHFSWRRHFVGSSRPFSMRQKTKLVDAAAPAC